MAAHRTNNQSLPPSNLHHYLFLLFFISLPHLPIGAKKVPYWGERRDGFRCYSCVTGSPDWSTERCNPRINREVYKGCGNGTSGCFKWIVNSEMTVRGCGINFMVEEEGKDGEEDLMKTWDFDKDEYPHLADMCRNLTYDMFSGRRLRKRTPQNILTILSHSNVNKFEHEKYIKIFNDTCTRILRLSEKFEAGLLARRRPPNQLRNVKFCKWYDACNGAEELVRTGIITTLLFALFSRIQMMFRC